MYKYRQYFIGFSLAVGLLAGWYGYTIFKDFSLMRQQNAAVINYLAEPIVKDGVPLKNDKGEVVTRAAVLAAIVEKAVNVPATPVTTTPSGARTP